MKVNKNYQNIAQSYLFSTIAKKVSEYTNLHPDKKIIKLGIGDVTLPLCNSVVNALKEASDEMGVKETFRGYGPEQGYEFLKSSIQKYYKSHGVELENDEIFISDGAKSDLGNILDLFDKTWKRERLDGIIDTVRDLPYQPIDEDVQTLHILSFPDYFEIFITGMSQRIVTLYISESEDGSIDDTTNTLKIMPMIHPHTHIIIDKSFAGKWLHVLGVPAEPIQIPAE